MGRCINGDQFEFCRKVIKFFSDWKFINVTNFVWCAVIGMITPKNTKCSVYIKGGRTPPTQFFVDGCYARLLLLYTYRGFSTTTQGQSTCRRRRSLILEQIWKKYWGQVIKLCSTFLERCGKLEFRNLVHY